MAPIPQALLSLNVGSPILIGFRFVGGQFLFESVNNVLAGGKTLLAMCRDYDDDQIDIPHS